jgi:uncharacterized protein involved in exopolysaccharide biosynthesis
MEDPPDSPVQRDYGRLDLRPLLVVLRRRLWILVSCVVLVPASALVTSLFQEKQYTTAVSLGILLGFLLGVGLAFLRERLDRRVGDSTEDESTSRRPQESPAKSSEQVLRGDVVRDR